MTRESFNQLKEQLINNIESLSNHSTKVDELNCYSALVTMLNDTTYENSKARKGLLTHFAIDSYMGDTKLMNDIVYFDKFL